jgi:hypothetical protein
MTELVKKYNEFITFLKNHTTSDKQKLLTEIEKLSDSEIEERATNYINTINEDKKYKNYLLNENKRLFMLNKDIYLVNFSLKSSYKKFSDEIKTHFWQYLQILYVLSNKDNENMEFNIKLLNKLENNTNKEEEDNLDLNIADKMIRDIAESFNDVKNVNSKDGAIESILKTSQQIGEKYKDDLESGKLNFMDMMNSFQKLAETIDENEEDNEDIDSTLFPSPDELFEKMMPGGLEGEQMKSMFKNMESMLSGGGKDNPLSMMGNLFGMNKDKNKMKEVDALTDQQIIELEKYYKDKGINLDELNNDN